mgnify:CR=1 FL=1
MSHWVYLGIAILSEVVGTTALKFADGFTRPGPTAIVVSRKPPAKLRLL